MIYHLPLNNPLYVVTMGVAVNIVAIGTDVDEANAAMAADAGLSLLAEHGPFLLLAEAKDRGVRLNTLAKAPSTGALLVEFDARFGDAVAEDVEIDACDAVDWISAFAPRVRAALDGAA